MKRLALIFLILISAETANAQWGRYSGESGVMVISTGGVAARFMPAADTDSARGAAFTAAMAAHRAGDRIILGPGRYDITAGVTPLDGVTIDGIGRPHIYATALTTPAIIVVNDDVTISNLKITTTEGGIGVYSSTPQDIAGLVIRNVEIYPGDTAANALMFSQNNGGGSTEHTIEARVYDSVLKSGSITGFGVFAYTSVTSTLRLFNCDVFGATDGILYSGSGTADIYGGTYVSVLDAITSGLSATVNVFGAAAYGDQADIYGDDGAVNVYWAGARIDSIVGNGIVYTNTLPVVGNLSVSGLIKSGNAIRATAQFNKTNTTLADVTGLSATLENGKYYFFRAQLTFDANVTGGHKYAMSGTATASAIRYNIISTCDATLANVITSRQTALNGSAGQAGCAAGVTTIEGYITTSAAGTLTVQFAQNAASGTSSILVGSKFEFQEVS